MIGMTIEAIEQQADEAFFIVRINRRAGDAMTRPAGSTIVQDSDGLLLVGGVLRRGRWAGCLRRGGGPVQGLGAVEGWRRLNGVGKRARFPASRSQVTLLSASARTEASRRSAGGRLGRLAATVATTSTMAAARAVRCLIARPRDRVGAAWVPMLGSTPMSTALTDPDRFFTREEYRLWCANQPKGRFERVDGHIVAMAPERIGHARVKAAIWLALRNAIRTAGVPCQALPDGVTVEIGESDYEPDALVNCGTTLDRNAIAATNPVIIVEVLSPGTAETDTGGKLAAYFAVPSVAHYLIVHPDKRVITHHRRNGLSIDTQIIGSGDIVMNPPGITITVDAIYDTG